MTTQTNLEEESESMTIPTLTIMLTLLFTCYGVFWHDETADNIRNTDPDCPGDS